MSEQPENLKRLRRIQEARRVLEIVAEYIKEGKLSTVIIASEHALSANTLRSWISDPYKLEKAYKLDSLIRLGSVLTPLADKNGMAYELALQEWGSDRSSQNKVNDFDGRYKIFHNLPESYTKDFFSININAFKKKSYHNFYLLYKSKNYTRNCDGFTFIEGDRLRLVGVYHQLTFHGSFKVPLDTWPYYAEGAIMIEDGLLDRYFFTKAALVKPDTTSFSELVDQAKSFVAQNYVEI